MAVVMERRAALTVRPLRGVRTVAESLKLEEFPVAKSYLYCSLGDIEIEDGAGGYLLARRALDEVTQEWFETDQDAVEAIREAVPRARRASAA